MERASGGEADTIELRRAAVARVVAGPTAVLEDGVGRRLHHLRLSVTEACNFRCSYCLPHGGPPGPAPLPLSVGEIRRLVSAFAALGVSHVRLTGGEPTLRQDVSEIVRAVAETPGVRRVAITTNGHRLARLAPGLRQAGLEAVNVSVDSLDAARFEQITGGAKLSTVVAGVEAALAAKIPTVKVNAVLLRGFDGAELDRFLAWTRRAPVTVRFIELMRTAGNAAFFRAHHLAVSSIARELENRGWAALPRDPTEGPATTFGHPARAGKVGLIAPYAASFCAACNRVRVSAGGNLRLCLFGGAEIPLRRHLDSDDGRDALVRAISAAVRAKPPSHHLREGDSGGIASLAVVGG